MNILTIVLAISELDIRILYRKCHPIQAYLGPMHMLSRCLNDIAQLGETKMSKFLVSGIAKKTGD